MSYSRWSNSVWYTYWSADMSDVGTERLAIHRKGGEGDYVVWDEHDSSGMTDEDVAECIPWGSFTGVTKEERDELIDIVREFFDDVYDEWLVTDEGKPNEDANSG